MPSNNSEKSGAGFGLVPPSLKGYQRGYSPIEVDHGVEDGTFKPAMDSTGLLQTAPQSKRFRIFAWTAGAALVVMLLLLWLSVSTTGKSLIGFSNLEVTDCPDCTFVECKRTLCPSNVPFVCTSGAAHDGCAVEADSWIGNSVCDTCCDSSNCAETEPTGDDDILTMCEPCTEHECATFGAKCPAVAPYVCMEGSAPNGCSDDEYHWPAALNGICTRCCNLSNCW